MGKREKLHSERKEFEPEWEFTAASTPLQHCIIKDLMDSLMTALLFAFYVRPPLSARKSLITLENMRLEEGRERWVRMKQRESQFDLEQ